MNILFIIDTLGRGGAERVLVNTLPELQNLGIKCEVAILFDKDDLARELETYDIKVHKLNLSYKWNFFEALYKLHKLLRIGNYEIIHAHLFFAHFYTALIKIFHPKIKTLTTFHSLTFEIYPPNTLWKKIRLKMESYLLNHFIDKYTACSKAVATHYEQFLNLNNTDVIYNGFNLDHDDQIFISNKNEILEYFPFPKPKLVSITPGRAHVAKGHKYLLEAIKSFDDDYLDIGFLFIGDGPEFENIKQEISSKELEKRVIQINALDQKKLFSLLSSCDMVILPSIIEGFPMVLGEAMSFGIPIIATNISGIPELVENEKEGLLVDPKDPYQLAQVIKQMSENQEMRRKMSQNAMKKIQFFDLDVIAKQWKKYYESLLD